MGKWMAECMDAWMNGLMCRLFCKRMTGFIDLFMDRCIEA